MISKCRILSRGYQITVPNDARSKIGTEATDNAGGVSLVQPDTSIVRLLKGF
jgi:hypothetical protein